MKRRRTQQTGWSTAAIDREALERLDQDDSCREIAPGSLPNWLRRLAERERLPRRLSWVDSDVIPVLYGWRGERLPRAASVGFLRACLERDEEVLALFPEYVHPASIARLVEHALVCWGARCKAAEVSNVALMESLWMPTMHTRFGDVCGVETLCALVIDDALHAEARPVALNALRDGPEPGSAMLALFARGRPFTHRHMFRQCLKMTSPVEGRRWWWQHRWFYMADEAHELEPMALEELVELIEALGFLGARGIEADEEVQWAGRALFEAFMGGLGGEQLEEGASGARVRFAARVLDELFVQTAQSFEVMAQRHQRWEAPAWRALFLQDDYLNFWSQRLMWCAILPDGERVPCRVCEDATLSDVHDEAFLLDEGAQMELLSGGALSERERQAWAEVLASYELIMAIEQL